MPGLRSKRFSDGLECLRGRLKKPYEKYKGELEMPQIKIPAVYYRGGTSKGIFFKRTDLPAAAQEAGEARDKILLRVLGSPDPYGKQIDGLGNASSSTSKAVILDKSERADHDVDYLFGQVSIDKPFVDWSGNCGNLTAPWAHLPSSKAWSINPKSLQTACVPSKSGRKTSAKPLLPMYRCKTAQFWKQAILSSTA